MTPEAMRRALELENTARQLRKKHDTFVLIKLDQSSELEFINVGDPVLFKKDEYHRAKVPIPDEARRYVFNLWRRETALKYNSILRELNQIGMTTELRPLPVERPFQ